MRRYKRTNQLFSKSFNSFKVADKNLVFLSYGSSVGYFRAIYCILSFSAWMEKKMDKFRLIVYTDQPGFFQTYLSGFSISYIQLTDDMLTEMLAETGFIHRRKVAVIDLTFKNFPDEDLIFIDSDSFFTKEPKLFLEKADDAVSLMHTREYDLDGGLRLFNLFGQGHYPQAFIDYIADREFVIRGQSMVFNTKDYSWNSGIIGLTKNFSNYMKDVIKLTDEFYAHSKWFVSEQLAFSFILQRTTTIKPADSFVTHYWGPHQRILVDTAISKLLTTHSLSDFKNGKFIRSSTRRLRHMVDCDLIYEQLKIALRQHDFIYTTKKIIQLVFLKLFHISIRKSK